MVIVSQFFLWLVVALMVVALVALARQVHLIRESAGPIVAELAGSVAPGEAAPIVSAPTLAGDMLTIGGATSDGRPLLLLFIEAECATCSGLLHDALSVCRKSGMRLVLLGEGCAEDYRELIRGHGLKTADFILNGAVGADYQIGKLPSAVLIDADGTLLARGRVHRRAHIEAAAALVRPRPGIEALEPQI